MGLPFFVIAVVAGLMVRAYVSDRPIRSAVGLVVATGMSFWLLAPVLEPLFDATRITIYAMICAACSAAIFVTLQHLGGRTSAG